jgi:hypothetical protein
MIVGTWKKMEELHITYSKYLEEAATLQDLGT